MPAFNPAQNSFVAGEVSPRLEAREDLPQFQQSLRIAENGMVLPHGGFTRRPGTAFVAEVKTSADFTRIIPFEFNVEQAYIFELGDDYMRIYLNQGRLEVPPGTPVEIVTPWGTAQLEGLKWVQSNDVLFVVHADVHPYQITRTSATTFTVTKTVFTVPPLRSRNVDQAKTVAISALGTTATFVGFTLDDTLGFDDGRVIMVEHGTTNNDYYTITSVTAGGASATVTKLIRVDQNGLSTTAPADVIAATDNFALGLFSDNEGATDVTFHQGRMWFGGAPTEPDRFVGSRSDDFFNFLLSNASNSDADNADRAISRRVVGTEQNSIRWMAGTDKQLFIGGAGQEFSVTAANDDVLTPTSTVVNPLTRRGSEPISPVVVDSQIIFASGRKLRELIFDERNNSFRARDITILAEHILNEGIKHVVYQQDPDSIIWIVREDGQLVGFTFEREQEIVGAHRQIFGGSFGNGGAVADDAAVIPTPDLNEKQVWVIVKRTIDGATKRYIEYIDKSYRPNVSATSTRQELIDAIKEGRFVDSFVTYSGPSITTLTGLDHLEGQFVKVLIDGTVHPDVVVQSGAITLTRPFTEAVVGLRELTRMMTQRFLTGGTTVGTGLGREHRIKRVAFMLYNTLGMRFGARASLKLDEIQFRSGSDPMDQSPPLLHTGFKEAAMPDPGSGWTEDPVIYVEQDQPLPLTLLAVLPSVETKERIVNS